MFGRPLSGYRRCRSNLAQRELTGKRDLTYSAFHRAESLGRFVGIERAQTLGMIDLDASLWVEYMGKQPLALVETARDTGQSWKTATVTRELAQMAGIPAFVTLYQTARTPNTTQRYHVLDIERVRMQCLHCPSWLGKPEQRPGDWRTFDPWEYARFLMNLREGVCAKVDHDVYGFPLHIGEAVEEQLALFSMPSGLA